MSHLEKYQNDHITVAARAKWKNLDPNFFVYLYSWKGEFADRGNCIMEITGAVFREAKSGPRKGQKCIKVPNTERSTFLTSTEVDDLNKQNTKPALSL